MRRPFFSLQQHKAFIGHEVKLKLRYPFENRRNFSGTLSVVDLEQQELAIVVGDEEFLLPYEQIEKSRLEVSFDD